MPSKRVYKNKMRGGDVGRVVFVLWTMLVSTTSAAELLLQDAISRLADGGCRAALPAFREIASTTSNHSAAPRALLYAGFCQEKVARKAAVHAYQEVIAKYRDEAELVSAARTRLARLGYQPTDVPASSLFRYVDSIPLPTAGTNLLAVGENEIWVAQKAGLVSVIDAVTRRLVREIPVGGLLGSMALSPDRRIVYITQHDRGLSAIERATGKVTALRERQLVTGLAVEPRTGELFLARCEAGIERMNPRSGVVHTLYAMPCPWNVAVARHGDRLYVPYQRGGPGGWRGHDVIARFSTRTGKLENVLTAPANVGCAVGISPDDHWLWENTCDACSSPTLDRQGCPAVPTQVIHVFDLRTERLVQTLSFSGVNANMIRFSPDSRLAVIAGGVVLVLDTRTREVVQFFDSRDRLLHAAEFDPSGRRLYISTNDAVLVYELAK